MVKDSLDYGVILERLGVGIEDTSFVIENIINYEKGLQPEDAIDLNEFLLANVKDVDILYAIVKLSDANRDSRLLSRLLDILLLKNIETEDSDCLVNLRVLCTKVIANYKDTSSVGALLYCLNNKTENYKIRLACADALGRIGDKFAVNALINVVEDEDEKSVYVKESATFALGLLGDTSAVDPLVAIMEAKQGLLGKFSFLKERIVEALGKLNLNSSKVFKVLKSSLMDSSPMVRINAIEALMNSDYPEALELIKSALHDEDDEVKRNALIAKYNLIGRDILDEVISLPGYNEFLKNEARAIIEEYEEES